ncbi:MAG: heme ABC exporter ATP-binding protein CcmA [Chloroflexi bacterium]|nr:MAG: heme ABC exporter ATP-binding protein CcmA [Chloroflexota bacterium]
MSHSLIEIIDLVKTFGFLPVLKKLNLTVERGEFIALMGPNGSGKSTLLRQIAGLSRPTSGIIRVGGWTLPDEAAAVRAQIGMVSHKPLLYGNLTAQENLLFFAKLYHLKNADERVENLLDRVGLKKRAYDLTRTFSRGMLQRLSIARALLHDPDVLLFDEPYTGLDQSASETLDHLLHEAHDGNRTIIMTTHHLTHAAGLASRGIILSRGVIGYDEKLSPDTNLPKIYTEVTNMVTAR